MVPVAIRVAAISNLEAAIIILDDEGLLSVCFLGTAPPSAILGLTDHREPDWERIQARRKELARMIREKEAPVRDAVRLAAVEALNAEPACALALRSQVCVLTTMLQCGARPISRLCSYQRRQPRTAAPIMQLPKRYHACTQVC
jgi:PTHB1 N-terminus